MPEIGMNGCSAFDFWCVRLNLIALILSGISRDNADNWAVIPSTSFMPTNGLVSGALSNVQTVHACSAQPGASIRCAWFNTTITCADNERILIRDELYGFRYKNPVICEFSEDRCMTSNECCSPWEGDTTLEYSTEQKYDVYKECSWKQNCTKRAQVEYKGKTQSLYSVLMYECIKEKQVVRFCQDTAVTGKSINIIFDGKDKTFNDNSAECICELAPQSKKVRYTLNAPDLRLMSENQDCNSKVTLSGLGNFNITCSAKFENRTSSRLMLGGRWFRLAFKSRPEFIWIRADVQGSWSSPTAQVADLNQLSVTCYRPVEQTTSIGQHKSTSEVASTSTTSSEVPILAIVVPIVLVVSGLAVLLIFIIRYRCKKMLTEEKETVNNCDRLDSTPKMKYDTLFSPECAVRTDDNYVVLEPENAYSSIRSDDIYPIHTVTGAMKANELKRDRYMTRSPKNQAGHGYGNLIVDSAVDNADYNNERIEEDMNSVINDLEDDKHEYLVLDPQSLYRDTDTAGLSDSERRDKMINDTDDEQLRENFEQDNINYSRLEYENEIS